MVNLNENNRGNIKNSEGPENSKGKEPSDKKYHHNKVWDKKFKDLVIFPTCSWRKNGYEM